MIGRRCAVLAAVALALGVQSSATASTSFSSSAAVRWLNQLREANGLPGTVTENPAWSAKCLRHIRWMERNRTLRHDETPGSPGFSTAGEWAGANAVLAEQTDWTANRLPWLTAPIHLAQLLAPELTEVGVAFEHGWAYATTWPGFASPRGHAALYAFPADGTRDVPTGMVASERPFGPGQFVGIPAGSRTGPYLYVYAVGDWLAGLPHVVSASLQDSAGRSVAVRHVDATTREIGAYLPPASGMVIPVRPLAAATAYTASVTFGNGEERETLHWRFQTAAQ